MKAERVFIGLGSNLAEPVEQIRRALQELNELPRTRLVQASPLYRSPPMGPADQPDYFNAVAELASGLEPLELLEALQALEQAHQRVRSEHWGPRTLDLDILCFGERQIANDRLTIPHFGLSERDFVLFPWRDIAPGFVVVGLEKVADLARCLEPGSAIRLDHE